MMNFTRSALGTTHMSAVFTSMETAAVPSFAQLRYRASALTIIESAGQLNAPPDVATIHPSPFLALWAQRCAQSNLFGGSSRFKRHA